MWAGVEQERRGGGSGGGRHAYGIVVVFAGMAYRSSIFEEDKEGDTRSALGGARGGGL